MQFRKYISFSVTYKKTLEGLERVDHYFLSFTFSISNLSLAKKLQLWFNHLFLVTYKKGMTAACGRHLKMILVFPIWRTTFKHVAVFVHMHVYTPTNIQTPLSMKNSALLGSCADDPDGLIHNLHTFSPGEPPEKGRCRCAIIPWHGSLITDFHSRRTHEPSSLPRPGARESES